MEPNKASWTAIAVIFLRAYHREHNQDLVFDDPVSSKLVTPSERDFLEKLCINALSRVDPELGRLGQPEAFDRFFHSFQAIPEILARARYNEEKLLEAVSRGLSQYVIVGAGLETFALRRNDLSDSLHVFEIDHPLTQAFKRERLTEAGYGVPSNLHFAPIDFEAENVATVLARLPYDMATPGYFSWLGVTQYLTRPAIEQTLTSIQSVAAPGSELLFSYFEEASFDPAKQTPAMRQHFEIVRTLGEPFLTGLNPETLATWLDGLGFKLLEDLGHKEQFDRYFAGRVDTRLKPAEFARLAHAVVA